MLTRSQFQEWKTHPVTKDFFDYLKGLREIVKEDWAAGGSNGSTASEFTLAQAKSLGEVQCLAEIISTEFEDIEPNEEGITSDE